ncbi:hypothetical protein ACWD4G_42690 [Streptomyces sp. NPDC002643]
MLRPYRRTSDPSASGVRRAGRALASLIKRMAGLEVPWPERAEAREPYEACDDDDLFVVAGREYAYDGDRDAVLASASGSTGPRRR